MTIAEAFVEKFLLIDWIDEDHRYDDYQLAEFRKELKEARESCIAECPESYDSAWICTFPDGSKAKFGNPHQSAFTPFFYAM